MREQVEDGDLVPGGGSVRHVLLDGIVNLEFATLFQKKDGGGGELLGDGADAELGSWRVRDLPFQVGEAVTLVEKHFAVARYEHGAHKFVIGNVRLDDLLHTCCRI